MYTATKAIDGCLHAEQIAGYRAETHAGEAISLAAAAFQPRGPAERFTLLFDEEAHLPAYLPAPFRQIYQGDWRPLDVPDRPYTFVNFVTARDGRVSFAEPGRASGADISGFSAADRWVMALLRAGADAVMMGEGTLHAAPEQLWISQFIFPDDAEAFTQLRRSLGLNALPLNVFISLDGEATAHGTEHLAMRC